MNARLFANADRALLGEGEGSRVVLFPEASGIVCNIRTKFAGHLRCSATSLLSEALDSTVLMSDFLFP